MKGVQGWKEQQRQWHLHCSPRWQPISGPTPLALRLVWWHRTHYLVAMSPAACLGLRDVQCGRGIWSSVVAISMQTGPCALVALDHSGGSDSGGAWRRQCLLGPRACEQRRLLEPSGWQNQQASCLGAEGRGPRIRTAMMVAGRGENDRNLQLSSSINFL